MAPRPPRSDSRTVIALCLAALTGTATARLELPHGRFTLAWVHSIEKVEWQEDWQVTTAGLVAGEARVKGSGAGMEPADDAVPRQGWYVWTRHQPPLPGLILARSDAVADHRLCVGTDCRPLSALVAGDGPVSLTACHTGEPLKGLAVSPLAGRGLRLNGG